MIRGKRMVKRKTKKQTLEDVMQEYAGTPQWKKIINKGRILVALFSLVAFLMGFWLGGGFL